MISWTIYLCSAEWGCSVNATPNPELDMFATRSLVLAMMCTIGLATSLHAADKAYLAGVIRNNTNIRITYQYKHNNGAWQTVSLNPGARHVYSIPYPCGNQTIHIRHDNRLGDNQVTMTNTTLAMHVCNNPNLGWPQGFIRVNDMKTIVLAR